MPNNRKKTMKAIKGKEGVHPGSRKAGQITRASLRLVKMSQDRRERRSGNSTKMQRPTFFMHALSSPSPITLASLKALIEIYIDRDLARIEELSAERRPGRPKVKEHLDLEERRRIEGKEYDTGMEVPDLTHFLTTRLLHSYLETDVSLDSSRADMMRMVRVFRNSDDVIMTKPGQMDKMGLGADDGTVGEDWSKEGQEQEQEQAGGEAEML